MATLWIIDGYNFIRQSHRFSDLEAQNGPKGRAAALRWLGRFSECTGEKVCVVFDAYSGLHNEMQREQVHGLTVLASRGGYTADEEIITLAQQRREAAVVVSSDKAIVKAVVKAGASYLESWEFEDEVEKILYPEENEESPRRPAKGNAFHPPKEKKKAFQLLKKHQ